MIMERNRKIKINKIYNVLEGKSLKNHKARKAGVVGHSFLMEAS
jgi:hypothetical protein